MHVQAEKVLQQRPGLGLVWSGLDRWSLSHGALQARLAHGWCGVDMEQSAGRQSMPGNT